MSAQRSEPAVKVEHVMSTPVVTIKDSDDIVTAAKVMKKHEIGCVVVLDKGRKPIGLVTERDIVRRVTVKDILPSKVKVTEAMSKPLAYVSPSTGITEAAKKMKKMKLRRLAVLDGSKLVGIVTSNDIVDITPALVDIMEEKSKIAPLAPQREQKPMEGYCDRCSMWSDDLKPVEGLYVCADCSAELQGGEEET